MSNDIDNVTPKGVLLVVSGPSGAGKGTICQMLRDQLPDLGYSISVTTRAPRTGEVEKTLKRNSPYKIRGGSFGDDKIIEVSNGEIVGEDEGKLDSTYRYN